MNPDLKSPYETGTMEHYAFCVGRQIPNFMPGARKEFSPNGPANSGDPDLWTLAFCARLHAGDNSFQAREYADNQKEDHKHLWDVWVEGYTSFFEEAKN